MGVLLYQINSREPYERVDFFPIENKEDEKINDFANIVLWEKFGGDLNAFDKEYGISVPINPLKDIVKVDFSKIKEGKVPIENLGTYKKLVFNKVNRWFSGFHFDHYSDEENKGIKCQNASREEICLAKYSKAIADDFSGMNGCYTAVKHAFLNAGIIDDYGDMPHGKASNSLLYFDKHPEKFRKIDVKKEDLTKLPAGKIIVYSKKGFDGHIAVTTGNGQEMSDCTDNMKWLEEHGEGSDFAVYELTENWKYDNNIRKLVFKPKK